MAAELQFVLNRMFCQGGFLLRSRVEGARLPRSELPALERQGTTSGIGLGQLRRPVRWLSIGTGLGFPIARSEVRSHDLGARPRALVTADPRLLVTLQAPASVPAGSDVGLSVHTNADGVLYVFAWDQTADKVHRLMAGDKDGGTRIKADGRVAYARLVEVVDAVQRSGVEGVTLLTAQQDAADRGRTVVPPKGLEMRVNR